MKNQDKIKTINDTDINALKFKHFRELKSGRDSFSEMYYDELSNHIIPQDVEYISDIFKDRKNASSCFRWILRGLNKEAAIRKVKTDMEISANAIAKKK